MTTEETKILLDLYIALYPAKHPRLWPCDCPPALRDEHGNAIPLFSCPYCRFTQLVETLPVPADWGKEASPTPPVDAPDDGARVTFSGKQLDNARTVLASDDPEKMGLFLTAWFGESVAHHPIENLRIFMATAVRTLEQEENGEIEQVIA